MARIGKKKFWKNFLIISLSLLTVAGAVGAGIALTNLPETKEVGALSWKVGGLNTVSGKETDDKTSIVMTKAVGMDGLNVEISEEAGFTGTYKAYYYTANGSYLGCSEEYSVGAELQDTFAATVKIVYTPDLSLQGKERLYFWDVYGYADDLTVTYNREQGEVLGETHMKSVESSSIVSITTLNDRTYAIDYEGCFYYSYDNIDWYGINSPVPVNKIGKGLSLLSYGNSLYAYFNSYGFYKYTPATESSEGSWEEIQFNGKRVKGVSAIREVNGTLFVLGQATNLGYPIYMYDKESLSWTGVNVNGIGLTHKLNDMIYVNGEYVVVGSSGSIFTSKELETWVSYRNQSYGEINTIYHDGTCYVLGGMYLSGKAYVLVGGELEHLFYAETNSSLLDGMSVVDITSFNGKLFAAAGIMMGGGALGELWMSEDHGGTWKVVVDDVCALTTFYSTEDMLLIGTYKQIYYLREF